MSLHPASFAGHEAEIVTISGPDAIRFFIYDKSRMDSRSALVELVNRQLNSNEESKDQQRGNYSYTQSFADHAGSLLSSGLGCGLALLFAISGEAPYIFDRSHAESTQPPAADNHLNDQNEYS